MISTLPLWAMLLLALHGAVAAAGLPQPVPAVPPILGDPPVASRSSERPLPAFQIQALPLAGPLVDTQDRETVRLFYRGVYFQSESVPIGWTGNYATGDPGTIAQSFQDAVARRLNWYRELAGVPASVALFGPFNSKDQQAALMMSANDSLSHTPPPTWTYYTADAAEAAEKSNLYRGSTGANAVTSYMQDSGANNQHVGHRRWVLYPQTRNMGTGDVPGGTLNGASVPPINALWVLDGNFGTARPATRDGFVAWPPKGYVPYPVVFGRWSLSYPNANFSGATVTVTRNGNPIPVTVEYRSDATSPDFGEDTIVWLLNGFNDASIQPRPLADETYSITVSGVQGPGVPAAFSYNVVVFDPDVITPGAPQAIASAPPAVSTGVVFSASVGAMPDATGYQIDLYRSNATGGPLTPGNSAASWIPVTSGYNALEPTEFHLYHATFETQQLTLGKALYVGQNASLSFDRRFGLAAASEVARVQVSLDGGVSWQDIHTEAGNESPIPSARVTLNLSALAGRMVRLRFSFTTGITAFPCSDQCGWWFTNVALTNVSELSLASRATLAPASLSTSFTVANVGNYVVLAQAQYRGTYFGDWGPGSAIVATLGSFIARTGVLPNTTVTSDAITPTGYSAPAAISVSGGSYSLNGGPFGTASGTINSGDYVVVQLTSAATTSTPRCATVTIGTKSDQFCATTGTVTVEQVIPLLLPLLLDE